MSSNTKRSGKGRQTIPMKKITNERRINATFSKRRVGLFKLASELTTLCGVEVVIIINSPNNNKAFCFGHPNTESLINRPVIEVPPHLTAASDTAHFMEAHSTTNERDLHQELAKLNEELEAGKKHGIKLDQIRQKAQDQWWWAAPIEEMSVSQLMQYKKALEDLKKSVICHSNKVKTLGDISNPANDESFAAGGSSNGNKMHEGGYSGPSGHN